MIQKSNTCAGLISAFCSSIKGFTLIELLVVVIIIAVLTAVAVPMYKRAVLKSRFSTVMPMAKSVADAQEVYYLGNGQYALSQAELDVTPVEANNTTVALSPTDGYDYVLAQRSDVPELHYIMYQRNSANYPGEIHCEAQDNNAYAEYVCKSFGGTQDIGKTITNGYTTYVISGTGATALPSFDDAEDEVDPMSCDKAREMGFTCTPNEETRTKKLCIMIGNRNVCRTKTYGEDGKSYTSLTCYANSEGVCESNSWKSYGYDANGNMTTKRYCETVTEDGSKCAKYNSLYGNIDYGYDADGNKITSRQCATVTEDGSKCATYASTGNYDYGYDANGNQTTARYCATLTEDGSKCATYSSSGNSDYGYDANGNKTTARACATLTEDGSKCDTYASDGNADYGYDADGNKTTSRQCATVTEDGSKCATYQSYGNYDYGYDANGNMTTERYCATVTADGSKCATYESDGNYDYGYDANGNKTTMRKCITLTSDGSKCDTFGDWFTKQTEYGYDANGNMTTERSCAMLTEDGSQCTMYFSTKVYTYDDAGKEVGYYYCMYPNLNTDTGECTAYGGTTVPNDN